MIPSLLAAETRAGVLEYLTTTFALADDDARAALGQFLQDEDRGLFRGPYLRLRTPFRPVEPGWRCPLGWMPAGFRPYRHQAQAFERLSTLDRAAQPTIVTTGTGSGKTESFLVPILDHCRRAAAHGETGIKAVVLYPMNALVTDQARRLAGLLATEPALAGVTAGVYIGGQGSHSTADSEHLVDRREVLRGHPPDILLTNYKMLDFLLLRREDAGLWAASASSLRFVVLDEFHTYDGAQGTDVAMLLRRLGATLRVAEPGRPLGRITPVATSATLGNGTRQAEMRRFAERVFGTGFAVDSVIGEERLDAAEVVDAVDFTLPVPDVDAVLAAPLPVAGVPESWAGLAEVFTGEPVTDPVGLGERLSRHFITRAAVNALADRPLPLAEAVDEVAEAGVLPWGVRKARDPGAVAGALLRYLALLSVARMPAEPGGEPRPLLHVEVQLWIREVSRMLRAVDIEPRFAWWHDGPTPEEDSYLPAAYCRVCGRSGWQALAPEVGSVLRDSPVEVWRASVRDRSRVRTLLVADPGEADVRYLAPATLDLHDQPAEGDVPVLATAGGRDAAAQRCPSCGQDDAVRFLGSSVATLVSVALTQMFGTDLATRAEKKTLVFTDSVQDAAHRASFIEGRAFQFNLRSMILRTIGDGPSSLAAVSERLARDLDAADLYAVTPPDFPRRLGLEGEWLRHPRPGLRRILANRLAFQAHLEFGLRSRLGRTLELTGTVAADIEADLDRLAALVGEIHENLPERGLDGTLPGAEAYRQWLLGLFDRLRIGGGIHHNWLRRYIERDGNRYPIWGGSPRGMPKFPRGMAAPVFLTTGHSDQFATLAPPGDAPTWLTDWTRRCLGVPGREGKALLLRVAEALAGDEVGALVRRASGSGAAVYGLDPAHVVLHVVDTGELAAGGARLRCGVCQYLLPTTPHRGEVWDGAPCPRWRCTGRLRPDPAPPENFYRTMYRSRRVRRIVTHEHTGLLDREAREDVETHFKSGSSPIDPNVLTCTPTLELGIDIGDLGVVTLASLPRATANYLQRVGRAGRTTGNALVLATVPSQPRDLYYFAEPRHLIDGEVTPPGAYLNATELLRRQFFAYCMDRLAAGDLGVGQPPPNLTGPLVRGGLEPGGWMRRFLDAVAADAEGLAGRFADLFGKHLDEQSRADIRAFAGGGIEVAASQAFADWQRRERDLADRLIRLQQAINDLEAQGHLDDAQREDRRRWIGERRAVSQMHQSMTGEPALTGLELLGLLPNYTLVDDSTVLDVTLWWTTDEDGKDYQTAEYSYARGSMTAITELAPGAAFYVRGQRIRIDAVDIGPAGEPLWHHWRLCPQCGWGTQDVDAPIGSCPRCGSVGVADVGAVHRMLPLRRVSAMHSRDEAIVDDDAEDRERVRFTTVPTVDVPPGKVVRAWRLRDVVFGAEYVRGAVVRRINVGPRDRPGQRVDIAGSTVPTSRFNTCVYCGVVDGSQSPDPRRATRHRGWCPTRTETTERWEPLLLYHDLTTQAVRLLLPVSTLHVDVRLVSFTAALLLGLRHDFGGDPQHLQVAEASMPDAQGGTRRFLVLHDTVPGGTGYLDRIGDPDRLRAILEAARRQLVECPCRLEGRAACHRCLLGVVNRGDVENADRSVAVDLLTEVLDHWEVDPIATVADVDIAGVELSEIEHRFRELVKRWVTDHAGADSSVAVVAGSTGEELDIRLSGADGTVVRWRMRPQIEVTLPGLRTRPDFLLTRQDAQAMPVAVYLDGRRYHASSEHNRTASDARRRAALRADGHRVWSLTWDDLDAFERFLTDPAPDPGRHLVDTAAQNRMRQDVTDPRLALVWGNPVEMLLAYLTDPEADLWGKAAAAGAAALLVSGSGQPCLTTAGRLPAVLGGVVSGGSLPVGEGGTIAVAARQSRHGCPVFVLGERGDFPGTVGLLAVLDDRDSVVGGPDHLSRWADWLRWANLAQFLPRPGNGRTAPRRSAEFWTARSADAFRPDLHPLAAVAPVAVDVVRLPEDWALALEYSHPSIRPLAETLADLTGAPQPGWEVGDSDEVWQVELAWPDRRVAVVIDDDAERDTWLAGAGWRVARWPDHGQPADDSATEPSEPGRIRARIAGWLTGADAQSEPDTEAR